MFEERYCSYDVCFRHEDFRCCFDCELKEDCEIVCKACKEEDYDCEHMVGSLEKAMENN